MSFYTEIVKEGYTQAELDHLFQSGQIPDLAYCLSIYGDVDAELMTVKCFLDQFLNRGVNIYALLEKRARKIFHMVKQQENHPLRNVNYA